MSSLLIFLALWAAPYWPRSSPDEVVVPRAVHREWSCAGNSYMRLQPGWKPRPPQCHKVWVRDTP